MPPKQQQRKRKRRNDNMESPHLTRFKRVMLWTGVVIVSLVILAFIGMFQLWRKGWLPTPEELPRYKERLMIVLTGYRNPTLPEGEVIGIDISHYQGQIDWDELSFYVDRQGKLHRSSGRHRRARQVDFVIAKATQGAQMQDSYYNANKQGAREREIPFGAYHFYSLQSPAASQADNYIHTAALHNGDIVPVLDVEPYKNQLPERDSVYKWLQIVGRYYGERPIIYTNEKTFTDYFLPQERFRKYPFWIARYGGKEPSRHHVMWQCAENGKVAGISGPVDLNVFRGTKDDLLHKYTIGK